MVFCRAQPRLWKAISSWAASAWSKSSPNFTASAPPTRSGCRSAWTSQTSTSRHSRIFAPGAASFSHSDHFFFVAGSWSSSKLTRCAWNSSRGAPGTATARPASAKTTACLRCPCHQRRSSSSPPSNITSERSMCTSVLVSSRFQIFFFFFNLQLKWFGVFWQRKPRCGLRATNQELQLLNQNFALVSVDCPGRTSCSPNCSPFFCF